MKILIICLLFLSGCLRITITDSVWYGSLGPEGATALHTLANVQPTTITLEQFAAIWDNTSDPLICTNSSTFAAWKSNLEKLCSFDNVCAYNNTTVMTATKMINKITQSSRED
jgi:hypothetical protein